MGFIKNVAGAIRGAFQGERDKIELARGASVPTSLPGGAMLPGFGNDFLAEYLRLDADLITRYAEYEEMDDYPELATALDIYADDATQVETTRNRTMWVTSKDDNVQTILNDLFHRTLKVDEELWEIARTLSKYGNDFEEILVGEDGVKGLNFLPTPTVRRIEGPRGELFGFAQDFQGRTGIGVEEFQAALTRRMTGKDTGTAADALIALEDWEVCHFRLRGRQRRSLYGHSVLEPARWIWKRLMLLEDAALVFRLQRAPEKYAFYVDVGNLPAQEALAYLNRVRQTHKKRRFVDPSTGKLNLRWEPLTQDEDIYIPVRQGAESARVEVLGSPAWQAMEDIEYFRDKLFAAIKVPKAYLGQEAGVARAVLSSEDVRFARTVLRVQRELKNGFRKIGRVHLAALGIDPGSVDYDLWMTVPSSIFELAQIEVRNARADLAGRMAPFVSLHFILSKVFGLSDEEIQVVMDQRGEDAKRDAKFQAQAQVAMQQEMPPPPDLVPGGPEPMDAEATGDEAGAADSEIGAQFGQADSEIGAQFGKQESKKRFVYPSVRLHRGIRGAITERELFFGSRDVEKRFEDKMDRLLRSNDLQARQAMGRMQEIASLIKEIHAASKRR